MTFQIVSENYILTIKEQWQSPKCLLHAWFMFHSFEESSNTCNKRF